jgi:aldehyde dehydrogenase (NAD+)
VRNVLTGDIAISHREIAADLISVAISHVNGEWVEGGDREIERIGPSTGFPLGVAVEATEQTVDEAVAGARSAQVGWRNCSVDVRRRLLLSIAAALREELDAFAITIGLETGMPLADAKSSVTKTADYFEYFAGWADKLHGSVVPVYPGEAFDFTLAEPYGVIAVILNWNGPLTSIARKVAPALAAGNCVVLKSPELSPFVVSRFVETCERCGLPPGVVNLVVGSAATGAALVSHQGIDNITFTGSAAVARVIASTASANLTPLVFELGGKSANLIFADSDLDSAARAAALLGRVVNAGQGCLLPTRLLVEENVYEEVIERVIAALDAVVVGDPLEAGVNMGPLVSAASFDRVSSAIADACARGDGVWLSGGEDLGGGKGYFMAPAVFRDVDNNSPLAQEEVFGPVLCVMPFKTEEQAVVLANTTCYGLAAYMHTSDLRRVRRLARSLKAGYLSVNGFNPMPPTAPFGGEGDSGCGREGGLAGIEEFVRPKNVYVKL